MIKMNSLSMPRICPNNLSQKSFKSRYQGDFWSYKILNKDFANRNFWIFELSGFGPHLDFYVTEWNWIRTKFEDVLKYSINRNPLGEMQYLFGGLLTVLWIKVHIQTNNKPDDHLSFCQLNIKSGFQNCMSLLEQPIEKKSQCCFASKQKTKCKLNEASNDL